MPHGVAFFLGSTASKGVVMRLAGDEFDESGDVNGYDVGQYQT